MNFSQTNADYSRILRFLRVGLLAPVIAASCVISIAVCSPRIAFAEFIPPEKTSASTPKYEGVAVNYPAGHYIYNVNWQGLEVGTAELFVSPPADTPGREITLKAKARSGGLVKLFYELRHVSESLIQTSPFHPTRFSSRQLENTRAQYRTVTYGADGAIQSKFWKPGKTPEEYNFKTNNLTLDPIAAAILASSISIQPNMHAEFDVFNGKHRFIIGFQIEEQRQIKVAGKSYTAWKAVPSVKKLTDTNGETRLRSAAIWIDASTHTILKLESRVFIGSIRAELTSFEPSVEKASTPSEIEQARGRLAAPESLPLE